MVVNKLVALSFKNYDNDPTRNSIDKYNMPLVVIKDFNALIDNKPILDLPVKKYKTRMKKLLECQETRSI